MQFNESYQLIGLKGLSTDASLDSLGIIVFDATCDVTDPTGAKLSEASTDVQEVVAPPEPVVVIKEEIKTVTPEVLSQPKTETDDSALIVAICAIIALVLVFVAGIYFYFKYVKGNHPDNSKKIIAVDDNTSMAEAAGLNILRQKKTGLEANKLRRAKTSNFVTSSSRKRSDLFADDEEIGTQKIKEEVTDYFEPKAP